MKKVLYIAIIAFIMCFSLCGCNQSKDDSANHMQGTITIVSGGETYAPIEKWIFDYDNGTARDGARKQPQEVADELVAIPYEDDFQIVIAGEPLENQYYTLFNGKFEEEYYRQPDFVAPQNSGEYILFVELTWGDEKSYTGYQYCFKLTVGTATIESEKENIQINGVTPSWMPDGEHISYYKNQKMIIVDKSGTSVDEIPLNGIMDESVISFMYSFSPDGKLLATANGIVDREGNVVSAGFPSNGVDKKSQGLMLKSIGWLDEDTAYVVDRLGITLYSVSTDTYRNATPGLADAFKQYPQYNQVYLEAVLLYYPYDALYKIWRHDSQLFYVGRREINDSYLAEDIFALTPDGESRIAQGNRDMGHSSYILWADGQYVIYSITPDEIVFYDYHTGSVKKQVAVDASDGAIQKGYYRSQTLYVGYHVDPSPENGFIVECIPLDGERTKFTTYRPGDTSLEVLTEQTDQVAGFSLVAANGDTLFYSIQHSTIENDEAKWWNALVAYDIATGENRILFNGEQGGGDHRSIYRVSPSGDTALMVCTPLDSSKEYFTIVPLV